MGFASDDLTPLLIPPPTQAVRYGQATILAWDPETFENRIQWRGVTLTNVPVLSGVEALTYQAGDTVGLLGWAPSQGSAGSWWILGRLIIPGAGAGAAAVSWMTTSLGRTISGVVFADRIRTAFTPGSAVLGDTSGDWVSLSGGPTVTDVEVSDSGTMIIIVDARIRVAVFDVGQSTGEISPQISGATSVDAGALDRKELGIVRGSNSFQTDVNDRSSTTFIATGLNAGVHSVEAMYRAFVSGGGNNVIFASRGLVAIGF